jgi:hypothetical protein
MMPFFSKIIDLKCLLILLFCSILLVDCKKDDDNNPINTFSCEIDGVPFISNDSLSFAIVSDYTLIIYAYKNANLNSSLMTLRIPKDIKTGILTMNGPNLNRRAEYSFGQTLYSTAYGNSEGTFEILKHTESRIKGTLRFKFEVQLLGKK